jgi:hypothetical protein
MGLAGLAILIVVAAFTGRTLHGPYGDGDLFWQKHLGEYVVAHHSLPSTLDAATFTAPGAAWVPQEWLLGIAAYLTIPHGLLWVLVAIAAAAFAAALLATAWRARRFGASPVAVAIVIVLLAIDAGASFGIRAQVFAWPFFALLLLVLDSAGPAIFWAFAVVAAWSNVHASAMLAIPIVWIDAAVAWLRAPASQRLARVALAIVIPAATLLTPLGVALPAFALAMMRSPIRQWIDEWQPLIGPHHAFFWVGGAPMVLLVALQLPALWRERPRDVLWSALLLILTIGAVRNAALLGIAIAPLAARAIDLLLASRPWWPVDPLRDRNLRRLTIGASIFAAALVLVSQARSSAAPPWSPPVSTFELLSARDDAPRVFCYDFTICSVARDYPNLRVFMDGRVDAYPLAVWNDFNVVRAAKSGWQTTLDAWRVDAVIAKANSSLDDALTRQPGWIALPQANRCCRAYVRRGE